MRTPHLPTRDELTVLLNQGMLVADIACELGYANPCSIQRHLKRYGIPRPGTYADVLRQNVQLTQRQRELIVGMLLGDGSIPPLHGRFRNYYLSFSHAKSLEDYATWKAEQLAPFNRPLTPAMVRSTPGGPKKHAVVTFGTLTHPDFAEYRTLFYPNGVKVVPANITELLTPHGIAVWYMDDGCLRTWHTKRGAYCEFATESFTLAEQDRLASALCAICNVEPRFKTKVGGTGHRIFLDRQDSDRFASVIRPHVHPALLYKLP